MARYQLDGIEEISRAFRELEPKLARKVIRQAARKGLKPVLRAIKKSVPVRSGALKKLVKIQAAKRRRRGVISLTVNINSDRQGKAFYGAFLNYGTKKMDQRAFMQKSFKETKAEAAAVTTAEILAGIEREAGR